ncbi:MAG: hypothetical protein IPM16_23765 [Chloroflexi bacterium]|nr:hypothetical protein [Chloroflexota bacterium]
MQRFSAVIITCLALILALLLVNQSSIQAAQPLQSEQYEYIAMSYYGLIGMALIHGEDAVAAPLRQGIDSIRATLSEDESSLPLPIYLSHLGEQGWRLVETIPDQNTIYFVLERTKSN